MFFNMNAVLIKTFLKVNIIYCPDVSKRHTNTRSKIKTNI